MGELKRGVRRVEVFERGKGVLGVGQGGREAVGSRVGLDLWQWYIQSCRRVSARHQMMS